jgi:hypothetical protein
MVETSTVRISGAGMPEGMPGAPLLATSGPEIVLGGLTGLAEPVAPTPSTMFGPRGAWLFGDDGPLWVCDTGHHRLLGWSKRPTRDEEPADIVIGQADMFTEAGRNGNLAVGSASLNVPTGVTPLGRGMAVADAWNHRILIWNELPRAANTPADVVLGQSDFSGGDPNRNGEVGAATLHWPYRVFAHEGRLYVTDTGNRRVLVWRTIPTENGTPADFALGQARLDTRDDNGGVEAGPSGLRWPHDLTVWHGNLVVTDAGNNRVLLWDGIPDTPHTPARWVLGQKDFVSIDHNGGRYWPDAAVVNMPYGVAAQGDLLIVADTANSRLIAWDFADFALVDGHLSPATRLTAQIHFSAKGDNRWGMPVRDSLCWPYAIMFQGDTVVVSDSGNHRVLLWRLA